MAKMKKNTPERFTALSNTIVRDDSLSWKARGIFLYLFSQSDDWDFYETEVSKHATDGRDSLRSGLKELEQKGYIKRSRTRNEKGQLMSSDWLLSDVPMSDVPMFEKPMYDIPTQVIPTLSNTNLSNTNTRNNNIKNIHTNELDINSNIDTKTSAYKKVVGMFENNGFGSVGGIIATNINDELDDFVQDDNYKQASEVLCKAIEIAVNQGKNKPAYVWGITRNWYQKKLLTVEAIEAELKKNSFSGGYKKPEKKKLKNGGYGTR